MEQITVEETIAAWTSQVDKKAEGDRVAFQRAVQLKSHMVGLLAEGRPVSVEELATYAKLPVQEVRELLQNDGAIECEFDNQGNLVGAALTLNPTPHHFRVGANNMYAWCALDTLFLPGLIGQTAEVKSICPVTGEAIHLTVTPEGVTEYSPPDTVLSITVPGISCCTNDSSTNNKVGPESEACSQMHFFASPEAAAEWQQDHPGVAVLSVEEAFRLADANWIERNNKAP